MKTPDIQISQCHCDGMRTYWVISDPTVLRHWIKVHIPFVQILFLALVKCASLTTVPVSSLCCSIITNPFFPPCLNRSRNFPISAQSEGDARLVKQDHFHLLIDAITHLCVMVAEVPSSTSITSGLTWQRLFPVFFPRMPNGSAQSF